MRTVPSLGYDIFKILKASDWFAGVADDGLAELADAAQIRHIKASQRLYKMGDKTSSLYCLLSGRVRLSIIGRLGQEFALTELEPLYWWGEASLEPDGTRIQEARVKADADVMLLPRAAVFKVAESYPVVYKNLFFSGLRRSRKIYGVLDAALFDSLSSRLAQRLLELLSRYGQPLDGGTLLAFQLSQNDLARLIRGSRQRVNKVLREWTEQGILSMRGEYYIIHDLGLLQTRADSNE